MRVAVSIGVAATIVTASVWLLTPPFPAPDALITRSYSDLVVVLGPPTGSIPNKFVSWQKSRGIAIWTLEAGYGVSPIDRRATPGQVSRCLWIDWAGVSILCRMAVVGRAAVPPTASATVGQLQSMSDVGFWVARRVSSS
jgi:hypothetical protein